MRDPDVSRRQASDQQRVAAAVVIGLAVAGLCGSALNPLFGPFVDGTGMLLASALYAAIGFAPRVD
jgi:hypothetical protein